MTTTTIGAMCIASTLLTKLSSAKGNEKAKKARKKGRPRGGRGREGKGSTKGKVSVKFSRRATVYFCTPSHFKGGSLIR